jgi:hypothetical protein
MIFFIHDIYFLKPTLDNESNKWECHGPQYSDLGFRVFMRMV